MIHYSVSQRISPDDFVDLLHRAEFAERRPVDDRDCIIGMLENANLLATAWSASRLVGVARSVTDFAYFCYLSDLAVDVDFQRRGIGKELIRETRKNVGPRCNLILLAAPKAVDYYPRIGFTPHSSAWVLPAQTAI